jgi:hypothetical protein
LLKGKGQNLGETQGKYRTFEDVINELRDEFSKAAQRSLPMVDEKTIEILVKEDEHMRRERARCLRGLKLCWTEGGIAKNRKSCRDEE